MKWYSPDEVYLSLRLQRFYYIFHLYLSYFCVFSVFICGFVATCDICVVFSDRTKPDYLEVFPSQSEKNSETM